MSGFYGKTNVAFEFENLIAEELELKVNKLVRDMENITPIDTGALKDGYEIKKQNNFTFSIINDKNYAHQILGLGRTGPGLGSLQLPDGILPFVQQWIEAEDN